MSLMIQCYLMMNRVDLAETQLRTMQRTDDDATITQLAATRFYLAQGGERIGDALAILNDLTDKYGSTPALLSAQAVCNMRTGNWVEAEKQLLQASERAITEPEVFVNLAVCALHTGKPKEVVERYVTFVTSQSNNIISLSIFTIKTLVQSTEGYGALSPMACSKSRFREAF